MILLSFFFFDFSHKLNNIFFLIIIKASLMLLVGIYDKQIE